MKKRFFIRGFRLLCAGALLTVGSAGATVYWNGSASNVIDDNLVIQSSSTVGGGSGTVVHAVNQDISVTLDQDITLTSNGEPGLCLIADAGRTITFNIASNLYFRGTLTSPLIITVQGPGLVQFILTDDKEVKLGTDATANELGAKMFVLMGEKFALTDNSGNLLFVRQNTNSASHVYVTIASNSILSYLAPGNDPHENGYITFDSANSGSGRMELNIYDGGAVYVAGSKVNAYQNCGPLLTDIDMTTLAGREANFATRNGQGAPATAGLLVTNENKIFTELMIDPWSTGVFTGVRHGFVEGANGVMAIGSSSYFDYVGLANNFCPNPAIMDKYLMGRTVGSIVKARNPSAFIVDGTQDQYEVGSSAPRAQIKWLGAVDTPSNAMVFRSGINKNGDINWGDDYDFTIDPALATTGAGEIVFDAEGRLDVVNSTDVRNNKIEILSWQVNPTGGSVIIGGTETNFPLRTFATDGGNYLRYNTACMFVNNRVNLETTNLVHTDKNHLVYEKDDINSQPTYVGGEKQTIINSTDDVYRGKIAFYNSRFMVHTCVALTGMDLFVPNGNDAPGMAARTRTLSVNNSSEFTFFNNGIEYRDGTGRQMILGTMIGSTACDSCCGALTGATDAHLNIYQETSVIPEPVSAPNHWLTLNVQPNDSTIMPDVLNPVIGQEIHTIYLGHESNISIGTQGTVPSWNIWTLPTLYVAGNYFSFETRGGEYSSPESSAVTGQGGIFVDNNGIFQVYSQYRTNIAAMVVKSGTGIVVLPEPNVRFNNRVGIAAWQPDMTDAAQRTIVQSTEQLSDYTLNWRSVIKDYTNYLPFEVDEYNPCVCPGVSEANVTSLPTVYGQVEQFQIRGSRLGNAAQVKVDNGWIRELVFLAGCDSADDATAGIVLTHHGRVGLGTHDRNLDSNSAPILLGVNGVTLIADGDGRVDLNEDVIIDNTCHILRGPNFNPQEGTFDRLQFYSDCERALIVKKGGVLDLRSFNQDNHIVEFAGNVKLVLEPGAIVALGGGVLRFTDHARVESTPVHNLAELQWGSTTASTDDFRVKIVGWGTIQLDEDSQFIVGDDSYVGVENNDCFGSGEGVWTDIAIEINDRAQMTVGSITGVSNSVFQVGNTDAPRTRQGNNTINFSLTLNGANSLFRIASRGFFGLGVGIVNNFFEHPADWTMDLLTDVESITINVPQGTFQHDRIFSMLDPYASLLAINADILAGEGPGFYFDYANRDPESPLFGTTLQATILGGGNMALIAAGSGATTANNVVSNGHDVEVNGYINSRLTFGLFSSKTILDLYTALSYPVSGTEMFNFWVTYDANTTAELNLARYVNASQDERNLLSVAYPDAGVIARGLLTEIVGKGGVRVRTTDFGHTLAIGAIYADLAEVGAPRSIISGVELP